MRIVKKTHLPGKVHIPVITGLLITIFILSVTVFSSLTSAQFVNEGQSLEISPPTQEVTVDPGKTVTLKAKIRNRTNAPLPIKVRLQDFVAQGEEGSVALSAKSKWPITSWSTVSPTEFTLASGESRDVEATVNVPATGVAGGRYGSFVFSAGAPEQKTGGGGASISQEVASLFLVRISGPVVENIRIESFSVPFFSEFGPVKFAVNFYNSGNIHMKPSGVIAVTDMFGRKVTDVKLEPSNVFPEANRVLTANWDQKMLVGKYTATGYFYSGGTKNQSMTASATFIVFPLRIAVIIILVLIVLYLARKRLKKAWRALTR